MCGCSRPRAVANAGAKLDCVPGMFHPGAILGVSPLQSLFLLWAGHLPVCLALPSLGQLTLTVSARPSAMFRWLALAVFHEPSCCRRVSPVLSCAFPSDRGLQVTTAASLRPEVPWTVEQLLALTDLGASGKSPVRRLCKSSSNCFRGWPHHHTGLGVAWFGLRLAWLGPTCAGPRLHSISGTRLPCAGIQGV
jgi:hypothetical protein